MGMSTHVVGIKPPNETWTAMKAVWDAATAVEVPIPEAVLEYFDGEEPDPTGVIVSVPARPWKDESREGYEVDLADLPKHVTTLRFYNAW